MSANSRNVNTVSALVMPLSVAAVQIAPAVLPPPIIVLGTRPACSTVVGAMLGCNPAAFAFPHLNLFVSDTLEGVVTMTLDGGQQTIHGLLRGLAYLYGSEQTIISIGMARRWLMRRLSWSTRQVFDALRDQVAPRRLVDKSTVYSHDTTCLERIIENLPDAYFVHVVEHPLTPGSVTEPARRNGRPRRARTEASQDQIQWLKAQRRISEGIKMVAPGRLTVVRMESLLADPHTEISRLCARLDLPNDEGAVAQMLHPENSPFAGPGPVGANLGDDPAFLHDPVFPPKRLVRNSIPAGQCMLAEVAEVAAGYGYI